MADLARAAARNNAEWCDIVCRLHGVAGRFHDDAWTVPRRSPPLYPDAVTLSPAARPEAVLAEIDTSPGCSVKDSFACLDLAPAGFQVLFDAEWICRAGGVPPDAGPRDVRWEAVRDDAGLAAWERAWGDGALFTPALLREDAVLVLGGYLGGDVVAGAIANRSATVVGVSNVFSATDDLHAAWRGCVLAIGERFPGEALVGYGSGEALVAACRYGFAPVGSLRVWSNV